MVRVLRALFLVLATCGTLAWGGWFYLWVMGTACAFSIPNGTCRARMPWELRGEDLTYLVLLPGAVVLGLWALAWINHRAVQREGVENGH